MTMFNWLPAREFMEEVFETKPLHIRNVLLPEYFLISDLNAALTSSITSMLPFTIGMHGRIPDRNEYCSEIFNPIKRSGQMEIDPEKVQSLLERGANIKIQRFSTLSEKASLIVKDIESWLGFSTSANGYFSLGRLRGLPVHWDTHDVLAVQLIGKKNWKIFKPTIELPVKPHRYEVNSPPGPNAVYMEVLLEAGDALYIPRGWWHDVTPVKGQQTLHLSVGLHSPNRSDFLAWVLNQQLVSDVEFRKSLLRSSSYADFGPMIANLVAALNSPELIEQYWEQHAVSVRPRGLFNLKAQE